MEVGIFHSVYCTDAGHIVSVHHCMQCGKSRGKTPTHVECRSLDTETKRHQTKEVNEMRKAIIDLTDEQTHVLAKMFDMNIHSVETLEKRTGEGWYYLSEVGIIIKGVRLKEETTKR